MDLAKFFEAAWDDGVWREILRGFLQIIPSYGNKAVVPELPWLLDFCFRFEAFWCLVLAVVRLVSVSF